jgi:hypothetical protein
MHIDQYFYFKLTEVCYYHGFNSKHLMQSYLISTG